MADDIYFNHILGNDQIKRYLINMVEKKAIGNSLLFAGIDGIGKSLFAEAFAKLVLQSSKAINTHPDVYSFRPEGKIGMHTIDSMRQFCERVYMAPFEGKWKIFIIHDAERMLTYSANSLLKTFEEPAKDSIIILLSSAPGALLPTVISRCRTIRFHHIEEDLIAQCLHTKLGKDVEECKKIAAISGGSIGKAFRLAEDQGDAVRDNLIKVFERGRLGSYSELIENAKQITQIVEEAKKQEETAVKGFLLQGMPSELNAAQQQNLEKEVDGAVALRQSTYTQTLFEIILSWYRDIHLIKAKGNEALIINKDYIEAIKVAAHGADTVSLESVQKYIGEAKLLLDRSSGLNIVLENLFLKLNLV